MFSETRNLNIRTIYIDRAKLRKTEEIVGWMFKCEKKKSKICDSIVVGDTFNSTVQGRTFRINHQFRLHIESAKNNTWEAP